MSNEKLLPSRFLAKFTVSDKGCWVWNGSTNGKRNYGKMFYNGKLELAHRIAYSLCKGEIPAGMTIDHLCNNTLCVNPNHLTVATQYDNNMRSNSICSKNKKKQACSKGHLYTEANTRIVVRKDGIRRHCRACGRNSTALRALTDAGYQITKRG